LANETYLIAALGSIGRRHLRNLRALRPDARIVVLRHRQADVHAETAGADLVTADLDEALRHSPAAAIVCTPAPFHVELATRLASAGAHLLVEKPLSDRDNAAGLVALCRAQGRVLMTAYTLRFSPSAVRFKGLLDQAHFGPVLSASVNTGQYLPDWRAGTDYRKGVSARRELGGGVVLELSHEFDYLRWFFGEVAEVFAELRQSGTLDIDVEDTADALLRFDNGMVASVHLDFLQRKPVRRCAAVCARGTLVWDGLADAVHFNEGEGGTPGSGQADRNSLYMSELEHFLNCVEARTTPRVTGLDGLKALDIALAVKQSAAAKRWTPVARRNT
jgi:predicted dehydrogenase